MAQYVLVVVLTHAPPPSHPHHTHTHTGETIASRRRIPTPEKYALFTVIIGKSTMIEDGERPQEIKLQWTLDKTTVQCTTPGSAYQPSSRFIAYKLRTPVS